eukprot:TRINITY_DN76707_c0_g1_i1.p1 TRINITY_DN76707_c0_g1~~TRINITY_DN76707_c0_g1_i1.p1  ORF type:complete len:275 (-),score=47.85 TRINITY_DN76707_c0_g1_i1:209-1033(-)
MAAAGCGAKAGSAHGAQLNSARASQRLSAALDGSRAAAESRRKSISQLKEKYSADGSHFSKREIASVLLESEMYQSNYQEEEGHGGGKQELQDDYEDLQREGLLSFCEADIDWMVVLVTKGRKADSALDPGFLTGKELLQLKELWEVFLSRRKQTEDRLVRFDVNENGTLEFDELENLLRDQNGGQQAPPDVVEWVMLQADILDQKALGRLGVARALDAWKLWLGELDQEHRTRLSGYIKLDPDLPKPDRHACTPGVSAKTTPGKQPACGCSVQ